MRPPGRKNRAIGVQNAGFGDTGRYVHCSGSGGDQYGGSHHCGRSTARIICGLLFPAGLSLVILMGGELFTGNCLISISVLEKETTTGMMLKNWLFVYIGNFIGSIIVAAGCAYFGQMNYSGGGLAVFTMKLAATKASLPMGNA